MFDLKEYIEDCFCVSSVSDGKVRMKSKYNLFYKVFLDTNITEFQAELSGKGIYESECLGIISTGNYSENEACYVGKLAEDLFTYLFDKGYFNNRPNENVSDIFEEVKKVVNYIKETRGIIDMDWWIDGLTEKTYETILEEANDYYDDVEPIDLEIEKHVNL